MSFLSNKFKLEVKASEPHVAKFISHTDKVNIKMSAASANSEYCILGINSSNEISLGFGTPASNFVDTAIVLNEKNINIYKDTIVGGNLVIDGYVITTGVDVMISKEDLFTISNSKGQIDMTSNILVRKQLEIIDRGITMTSNLIMQSIPSLSQKLFEDGLDVITSNKETIEFLKNPYNYTIERFENRFATKSADDLRNGTEAHFFINDVYTPALLVIQGDLQTSNMYCSNIDAEYSYAQQYYADGSVLTNVFLNYNVIDGLKEGSNLFYKAEYVGAIAAASNTHLSNHALSTFITLNTDFQNVSNYIQDTFVPQLPILEGIISENLVHASNQTAADTYYLLELAAQTTQDTSNYILYNISISSNYANKNVVFDINFADDIKHTSNYIEATSNALCQQFLAEQQNIALNLALQSNIIDLQTFKVYDDLAHKVAAYSNIFINTLQTIDDLKNTLSNQYVNYNQIAMVSNIIKSNSNQSISYMSNFLDDIYNMSNAFILGFAYPDRTSSNKIYAAESVATQYLYNTIPHLQNANRSTSNFLQSSSNKFVNQMTSKIANVLVYNTRSSNQIETFLSRRQNTITTYSNTKYNEADTKIRTKLASLNVSKIANGTSNFYYTEGKFNEFFSQLRFDNFSNGSTNKFIVNNIYNGNINILGTVYASNIFVQEVTSIHTNVYQTGNCMIDNLSIIYDTTSSGSSGSGTGDLLQLYNEANPAFIVKRDKIGIFKSNPVYDFDVSGIAKAPQFIGRGNFTNVNLDDKNTNQLVQGSNLYFTAERVRHLINTSNMNTSNYARELTNYIDKTNGIRFNYIFAESNMIASYYTRTFAGAYASNTVANVMSRVDYNNASFSNYARQIYNESIGYLLHTNVDVANYWRHHSNMLYFNMNNIERNHSNYILSIYPRISKIIYDSVTNISNYARGTDTFLSSIDTKLSELVLNQSNYAASTCNIFFNKILPINENLLNYINGTSNVIAGEINASNIVLQKYTKDTISSLTNFTSSVIDYLNSNVNIYTIADIYAADNILQSADAKQITKLMNEEGFLVHFVFRAGQTYNTPIYYIGSSSISVVNIKILYGSLYLRLGYKGNSLSLYSTTVIQKDTWYTVDLVAYIRGSEITLKMYIDKIQNEFIMLKNDVYYGSGLMQTSVYYDALKYANLVIASEPAVLPININGNSYYIAYTEGIYNVCISKNVSCSILMIGGGGGGGYNYGGGGGAGAYYYATNYVLQAGNYRFCVGGGGAGATEDMQAQNGSDTYISFDNTVKILCKGGGHGGGSSGPGGAGGSGGCGGGGSGWDNNIISTRLYAGGAADNTGTIGTGFAGGSGYSAYTNNILSGGGGGGIGGVGQSANATQKEGGNGGNGLVFDIKGVQEVYGGGGGGGEWATYTTNPAGLGGGATIGGTFIRVGGNAIRNVDGSGENGKSHTGSGGGAGRNAQGGSGGSGIIIIRFLVDDELGFNNTLDTYVDTRTYSPGVAYTNTYFSSNSYIFNSPSNREQFSSIIASSNYDYQYTSNIRTVDAFYYDNADDRLINVYDLNFVLTEVYTNIQLDSGYYYFVLDLQNEVSADLLIAGAGADYFNAAFYYNPSRLNNPLADIMNTSNQTTAYPIYLAEGYYRMYLRMLRTIGNRHKRYFLPKYYYSADWQGSHYSLNNSNGISYVSFSSLAESTEVSDFSHLYMMNDDIISSNIYAGNVLSHMPVSIQDFKIFNKPLTMSADYSINNILGAGKDSDTVTSVGRIRANRWRNGPEYIYYDEGNVGIGQIDYNASLEIFTKWSINSLKTNNPVWTNLGIIMSSDERIKTNMEDISDAKALEDILKIEPKQYSYIDRIGHSNVYGFIAQQIKDVIPHAVTLNEGFVPNIYMHGVLEGKQITLPDVCNIAIGDKVLIMDAMGNRYVEECCSSNACVLGIVNKSGISGNIFVYGTYVDDFHTLDKTYIYTLNVCALQELHRRFVNMQGIYDKLQNMQTMQELPELPELPLIVEFDDAITIKDKVELLKKFNDELMQNLNKHKYIEDRRVAAELAKLKNENNMLLDEREKLIMEYEALTDATQNQMNEISTIKTIMQLKI